jgi:hypothetical protein
MDKHAKTTKPARSRTARSAEPKPTRSSKTGKASSPSRSGKRAMPSKAAKPGTERARDEQRSDGGPRYAGGPWAVADERGDQRFGHARVDDANQSELAPGEADNDDDESPSAADPDLAAAEAAGEIESGGERAGMGRGEKPRKAKSSER